MRGVVVLLLLTSLTGCFGDTPSNGTAQPPDEVPMEEMPEDDVEEPPVEPAANGTSDGNETPERREPVTWTISISGDQFVQGSITIQRGDTVNWVHEDGTTPHTVTSDDGAFDSGSCPGPQCMTEFANSEFDETFGDNGEYPYHCQVHPSMTGTITVLEFYEEVP